jgi:hypothetical protein
MLGSGGTLAVCLVALVFFFCLFLGFLFGKGIDGRRREVEAVELVEVRSGSFYRQPRLQRRPRPEPIYEEVGEPVENSDPDQLSEIYSEVYFDGPDVSNIRGSRLSSLFWAQLENRR